MKDPAAILRKAYIDRLTGQITSNNKVVKIYDSFSTDANTKPPYIVITGYTDSEIGEGSKQSYGLECFITLTVYTKFQNSYGGQLQADNIVNQITELVRTRSNGYFDLSPDWEVITTLKDSSFAREEMVSDGWISSRIIRFRHKLQEL